MNSSVTLNHLEYDSVRAILAEYKIHNADISFRCDATADDLIDVIEGNRIYIPCIYVLNKIDQISIQELEIICKCWVVSVLTVLDKIPHSIPISYLFNMYFLID
jgi:ribosome-interacting GTPase 1